MRSDARCVHPVVTGIWSLSTRESATGVGERIVCAQHERYLTPRSTPGAFQRQASNAICTLNTASGSLKSCPQSSIAWVTRY